MAAASSSGDGQEGVGHNVADSHNSLGAARLAPHQTSRLGHRWSDAARQDGVGGKSHSLELPLPDDDNSLGGKVDRSAGHGQHDGRSLLSGAGDGALSTSALATHDGGQMHGGRNASQGQDESGRRRRELSPVVPAPVRTHDEALSVVDADEVDAILASIRANRRRRKEEHDTLYARLEKHKEALKRQLAEAHAAATDFPPLADSASFAELAPAATPPRSTGLPEPRAGTTATEPDAPAPLADTSRFSMASFSELGSSRVSQDEYVRELEARRAERKRILARTLQAASEPAPAPAPATAMAASLGGFVLAVPSGDTLVISAKVPKGIPPRKKIKLSNVTAPQLGWRDRADEPFAWKAREALRSKAVGKSVTFRIDNDPGTGRAFGEVWLDGERLSEFVVSSGYGKVRDVRKAEDEDHVNLKAAEQAAQSARRGMWTTDEAAKAAAVRTVVSQRENDHLALFERIGGKPVDAIVESVRDGSSLRLLLLPTFESVTLLLCGVRTPGFHKDKESGEMKADPFAAEAQFFVEARMLNRQLQVVLEVPDERGNFFGTVLHPRGNIAVALLKEGLGKYVDWSAAHVDYAGDLRAAQDEARGKRLRLWANWTPPKRSVDATANEFTGRVMEVMSGDALVVLNTATGTEMTIFLASVRAPRFRRSGKSEPFAYEARETLRKLTIGKNANVVLEYVRQPAPDAANQKPRTFATVTVNGKNVAARLIKDGLATCVRHRDDDERSHHYDALMAAEVAAKKAGRGQHSTTKKAGAPHIRGDASGDAAKGQIIVDSLKGRGSVVGVVEHVLNGARFKIYLPSEGVVVPFALAHVRAPRHDSRAENGGEPFGLESALFARRTLLHRDVKLEIETCDKRGTTIGNLFINKKNFAVSLLTDGLAYISGHRWAERSPYYESMAEVEAAAKAAKRGYWATYVEPKPELPAAGDDDADDAAASSKGPKYYDVVLTEIIDACNFYLQLTGKAAETLEAFMADFAAYHASYAGPGSEGLPKKLKAGVFVAAKFSLDSCWYRAKIVEKHDDETVTVLFVDYGNSERVALADLRPITDAQLELAPQAHKASMALLLSATDEDLKAEADDRFKGAFLGATLRARVEYKERGSSDWFVTLYQAAPVDADAADAEPEYVDIAADMLRSGLVRVNRKAATKGPKKALLARLAPFEEDAQEDRLGMWTYGIIDYDEEDA
ncbi:uncharacterized protein AMSG_11020 [Thecamonas trahens ATCC 50062]|uniref:Uncharacterized protein n=1 Tax=Thecamonas trahens ATCC 50062 TaxID=461836 RepID=A0A0L0DSN5_THETB|nr:hypothetical protein AMSG_11020 [Thecamonas trahens ATCC 50062]KNC55364.1 hypothetical protein AMSG_11020 [Thecamonas trahens ATCC 50062]|eukprot:XP_013752998.1 hypothetical protein AMSG_11020 [Thecamonas trahens ATCC 50062]